MLLLRRWLKCDKNILKLSYGIIIDKRGIELMEKQKEVYGIIYVIRNKVNNKLYIGQTTNKKGFNGRYHFKGEGIEKVYNFNKYSKDKNKN